MGATPAWTTACLDWERRLINGESIIPPPIFPEQAEQALAIFKLLQVTDLPKTVWDEALDRYRSPNFGECSDQFVFDFVAAIFGGYDAETGKQLIREYYLLISKKNTKSTIAAGIMLTALILCWREGEEHLILAPTKEVAGNSYVPAAAMVRADPELDALFHVADHLRTITHLVSKASLKVVAADTDTVSGKKSGRVLIDEHWLFGKRANAGAMFLEALGGQVSRDEGWVIYLTTQSDEPPAGVFKEKLDYYRDVRDGKIEDQKSLGVLYEYPAKMLKAKAYLDPSTFYITNPNLGRSVSLEWLEDQLKKLEHKTDGSLQKFLAKHLNVQIGMNLRADRWSGADFWERQATASGLTLHDLIARCEVITAGIDGGGLDDLLGLAFVGRERDTGKWLAWTRAWAHPIAIERRKSEESKYSDFEQQGDLVIIEELPGDVAQVAAVVREVNESGLLASVGLDPEKTHKVMFQALVDAEIEEAKCFGIPQGWKLTGAISVTERKLAEGVLLHGGQPLMNWCVGNAKVEPRGNASLITKQASGTGKIDPLMALFNAVQLMALNPEPRQTTSIYDEGVTI